MAQATAFRGVRIFDGSQMFTRASVIVQDETITAIGDDSLIPDQAKVIDGAGQTLLPGLIDAHTHIIHPEDQALRQALIFGVTTELDMFMDYRMAAVMKQRQEDKQGSELADLRSCGTLVTATGGHGTEYGLLIPTINAPQEAQAFVDARIAEGSDYIKIIYDDGHGYGMLIPTISKATLEAVVTAAHIRGKLAIVHVMTLQQARDAIEVGADGLAHLFIDEAPDPDFGHFIAMHRAFVVPTLTTLESMCHIPGGITLTADSNLAPYLSQSDLLHLRQDSSQLPASFPQRAGAQPNYAVAELTVKQLKVAHVPILAGTDAPNPGTVHGASLHRELELLVQAGLTPLEALAAATSVPAAAFHLIDRGRIAVGLRADLLLVKGDPTVDIKATRDIVGVWKRGIPVARQAYRSALEQQQIARQQRLAPAGSESGLVSDFEDGTLSTRFGSGWQISTDTVIGGTSTAEYQVVLEGAPGSKGSLLINGNIAPGLAFAWAGAIFFPGSTPFAPANLSAKKMLSFWAKGDGQAYRVIFYAGSLQAIPAIVPFVADAEWQHFQLVFSQFNEMDGHDLLAVLFAGGPTPGHFRLQIDDVQFN